tara:strand:+ start:68 stop:901 length:834 start_codon:yes stop_codon:yes gene_type:complete
MSKAWEGGIISKNANYRTTSNSAASGVWSPNDQLRHKSAGNWPTFTLSSPMTDDTGLWIEPLSIIETTTSSDNTSNYSTFQVSMDNAIANVGTTGRLYFAVRVTANTTYYNDFILGAVQVLTSAGSVIDEAWSFSNEYNQWQNTTRYGTGYSTLSSMAGATWSTIASGGAVHYWKAASSTGSSRTGAAGGINTNYGTSTIIPTTSAYSIAQVGANYYIYTETSGATHGEYMWCRSPSFTIGASTGVVLRFAYHACTTSGGAGMVNTVSEPLLTVWYD